MAASGASCNPEQRIIGALFGKAHTGGSYTMYIELD